MTTPGGTMREARVDKDSNVTLHTVPMPQPTEPDDILVRVHVCGINPKDWKMPAGILTSISHCPNSGDDIAGTVIASHPTARPLFPAGTRIAALHRLGHPHGAFADFALVSAFSAFHIPDSMSFADASTLPMACFMAGIGLFAQLRVAAGAFMPLREVGEGAEERKGRSGVGGEPLLIIGATSSVGSLAVRLAVAANVHPLILVAGSSPPSLTSLLDPAKGDVLLSRHLSPSDLADAIRAAIPAGRELNSAFDVISEGGSWRVCSEVLSERGRLCITLPPAKGDVKKGVEQRAAMAGSMWGTLADRRGTVGGSDAGGDPIGDLGFKGEEGRRWAAVFARDVEGLLCRGELKGLAVEVVGAEDSFHKNIETTLKRLRWGKEGKRFAVVVNE